VAYYKEYEGDMKKLLMVLIIVLVLVMITGCIADPIVNAVKNPYDDQCKQACQNPRLIKPPSCTCPTPIPTVANVTQSSGK
jgi:hypothetical protein